MLLLAGCTGAPQQALRDAAPWVRHPVTTDEASVVPFPGGLAIEDAGVVRVVRDGETVTLPGRLLPDAPYVVTERTDGRELVSSGGERRWLLPAEAAAPGCAGIRSGTLDALFAGDTLAVRTTALEGGACIDAFRPDDRAPAWSLTSGAHPLAVAVTPAIVLVATPSGPDGILLSALASTDGREVWSETVHGRGLLPARPEPLPTDGTSAVLFLGDPWRLVEVALADGSLRTSPVALPPGRTGRLGLTPRHVWWYFRTPARGPGDCCGPSLPSSRDGWCGLAAFDRATGKPVVRSTTNLEPSLGLTAAVDDAISACRFTQVVPGSQAEELVLVAPRDGMLELSRLEL